MTLDQIADMLAERFALDRDGMYVKNGRVSWGMTGGGAIAVHQHHEYITEAFSGGTDLDGSDAIHVSISLPWYRHDLIPWAVEQVSAIVLQARVHGAP